MENNIKLPEEFSQRMKKMLGSEYDAFLDAYNNNMPFTAIRINQLKESSKEKLFSLLGELKPVPWCKNGYYVNKSDFSGKHPYHMAGLAYFQEPSAMAPVEALKIEKGDIVLDLCAAPGGKSTAAAEKLSGSGLLVANEIIEKRSKILAENIVRMGIKNAIVTNETPSRLAKKYKSFFNKIIVDAPCSGEGMFKKEPQAITEWSVAHTESCAERQKKILSDAFEMLCGGGYLVYSTCTFAPVENEGIVDFVLSNYPDVELAPIELDMLSPANGSYVNSDFDMSNAKRIFPHKNDGEGHFIALFHKKCGEKENYTKNYKCDFEKLWREFEKKYLNTYLQGCFVAFGEKLFLMPKNIDIDKIKVELAGLYLGVIKKDRFEPAYALGMALKKTDFKNVLETENTEKYFSGETLPCDNSGWTAVLYDGYPIGWGKASGGVLKNHFPKYLRF